LINQNQLFFSHSSVKACVDRP